MSCAYFKDQLFKNKIYNFPNILNLSGSLYLTDSDIGYLPENCEVFRDVSFENENIAAIPVNFRTGGDLSLAWAPVRFLPDTFFAGGNINLTCSLLRELPANMVVAGHLDISGTPVLSLPFGLIVAGDLDLSYTCISSLPEDLKVCGEIHAKGTRLHKEDCKRLSGYKTSYNWRPEWENGKYIAVNGKIDADPVPVLRGSGFANYAKGTVQIVDKSSKSPLARFVGGHEIFTLNDAGFYETPEPIHPIFQEKYL